MRTKMYDLRLLILVSSINTLSAIVYQGLTCNERSILPNCSDIYPKLCDTQNCVLWKSDIFTETNTGRVKDNSANNTGSSAMIEAAGCGLFKDGHFSDGIWSKKTAVFLLNMV
mmetsp:Transcript_28076/g.26937  ORF Transcript_28076/g.26937 Transcript_28076/m.26937 type:complete len:113 (+) Transcript_28076:397-735(+)